jgi:RNA polymerase sigma-70 factor (ECF subfamily)
MKSVLPDTEGKPSFPGDFATTHWSVVLNAGHPAQPQAQDALERLCRAYWPPLYAYARRRGRDIDLAKDLTQEFFFRLLAGNWVNQADKQRGKFRSFLLASFDHFLSNEWNRSQRQKRGGGCEFVSLECDGVEERYCNEIPEGLNANDAFDRKWAETVLERVMTQLAQEFAETGQRERFEVLKPFLTDSDPGLSYADAAVRLGSSEAAVKSAIHRLRRRFAELFRAEIAQTVSHPSDIDAEIRSLFAALNR